MFSYAFRRILYLIPTVFLVLSTVFIIMHVVPGDPTAVILGFDATAESRARLREELGLDRPLYENYLSYMRDIIRGNLGHSIVNGEPVLRLIVTNLPYSFDLGILGLLISIIIGIPMGIVSALHRNRLLDYLSRAFSLIGLTVPGFVLGLLLLIVFSLKLGWFPIRGGGELGHPLSRLSHAFLPGLSLGLFLATFTARLTRSSLIQVLSKEYILAARAKGLKERKVIYKHALKNTLLPVVTVIGVYLGHTLGGVVLLETVFNRPGLGLLLAEAVLSRDFPVIQGTIVCFSLTMILVNILVDLSYAFIDPRIKYQ